MGAQRQLCPSAQALVNLIKGKMDETQRADLHDLCIWHLNFIDALERFPSSRDRSIAITHAEGAFARALKGIADDILKSKE